MPEFIHKYIPAVMPDTFMYLGYCSSLHSDAMWNAFKEKGVKVAFGWSRHIRRRTNVGFFDELMEEQMLPESNNINPLTAGEALAAIPEEEDLTWDDHDNGHIILKTASSEWNNFIFDSPEYIIVSLAGGTSVIVWDPVAQNYAPIHGNEGELVSFPCTTENISEWLNSVTDI